MSVYPWVVVGTDGSATATQAVVRAAVLAAGLSAPLLVAMAYHRDRPEDYGPPSQRAQMPGEFSGNEYRAAAGTVQDAAALATSTVTVDVDTACPEGEPATALLELAERHPGSLLVVGSQGLGVTARFILGNVPHKVIHHAVGDVLVVRTGEEPQLSAPRRLLVGTDGSTTAARAVGRAVDVAAAVGAEVTVMSAQRTEADAREAVEEAGQLAQAAGVPWHAEVRSDAPAEALLDAAGRHDLIVLGNKGMTGASRFLLGSVPNKVSHHIRTDLLIVKTNP